MRKNFNFSFVRNSDDDEVDSPFFPMKSKSMAKVDLSDTFSLQEMTINSDSGEESDDSQNLELLPPGVRKQYVNKFINYVCCFNARIWMSERSMNSYVDPVDSSLVVRAENEYILDFFVCFCIMKNRFFIYWYLLIWIVNVGISNFHLYFSFIYLQLINA